MNNQRVTFDLTQLAGSLRVSNTGHLLNKRDPTKHLNFC